MKPPGWTDYSVDGARHVHSYEEMQAGVWHKGANCLECPEVSGRFSVPMPVESTQVLTKVARVGNEEEPP